MKLAIVGASGHGKVVADIAIKRGYTDIIFLDDDESVKSCMGFPVVGKIGEIKKYKGYDFFVAIGNCKIREKVQEELVRNAFCITTLIHPEAVIGKGVSIGKGTWLSAGVIVSNNINICADCMIGAGAVVVKNIYEAGTYV